MNDEVSDILRVFANTGLRLGVNWKEQFRELLTDISKRDSISPKEIIGASNIQTILKDKKMGGPQKLAKVKKTLLEQRYPLYSKTMRAFKKELRELNLSSSIKVTPTPFFEDEKLSIEYTYETEAELKEIRASLKKLQGVNIVKKVLQYTEDNS